MPAIWQITKQETDTEDWGGLVADVYGNGGKAFVPNDPGNRHYAQFLRWQDNGGSVSNLYANEGSAFTLQGSVNTPNYDDYGYTGKWSPYYAPGTRIYWKATGNGIDSSDFDSDNQSGSFLIEQDGTFKTKINIRSDYNDEGFESANLQFFTDEAMSKDWGLSQASLYINDTSTNPYIPQTRKGGDGKDDISGRYGHDKLYGMFNDDKLTGLGGNDKLFGGYGDDRLYGGDGDDQLYGEQEEDYLFGGSGNDIINGGTGADYMSGGAGNDIYYVDNEGDVIDDRGLASDVDTVVLQGAARYLLEKGIEAATGNSSNNTLIGNSANNTLSGQAGNDTLNGNLGNDVINGGSGRDTAQFSSKSNRINLNTTKTQNTGDGRDRLISIENVNAGSGNDVVTGNKAANTLNGMNGNDRLYGAAGNDIINGGSGRDTAVFSSKSNRINLNTTKTQNTGDGTDRLISIENVNAGSGNDVVTGNKAANTLNGENGNDRLYGGIGNDVLIGGGGTDRVWGQGGRDTFRVQRGSGYTIIEDFNDGVDRIQLGSGSSGLQLKTRGEDMYLYQRGDLMAIVEDAVGDLQRSGNFLV